jgi:hypothetical protein
MVDGDAVLVPINIQGQGHPSNLIYMRITQRFGNTKVQGV